MLIYSDREVARGNLNSHILWIKWPLVDTEFDMPGLLYLHPKEKLKSCYKYDGNNNNNNTVVTLQQ
jgi:hypothetical protein